MGHGPALPARDPTILPDMPPGRAAVLYQGWEFTVTHPEPVLVHPDGCRDLIVLRDPEGTCRLLYSDWDRAPRAVQLPPGTRATGFRLAPGLVIAPAALAQLRRDLDRAAPDLCAQMIEAEAAPDPETREAIAALTRPGATVGAVARHCGLGARSLQRRFQAMGLPRPDFWRQLGRARRAALALAGASPLAEIACAHGFSDQAHLSRECLRWFGSPPARLRRDSALLAPLLHPGLGNWTTDGRPEAGELL